MRWWKRSSRRSANRALLPRISWNVGVVRLAQKEGRLLQRLAELAQQGCTLQRRALQLSAWQLCSGGCRLSTGFGVFGHLCPPGTLPGGAQSPLAYRGAKGLDVAASTSTFLTHWTCSLAESARGLRLQDRPRIRTNAADTSLHGDGGCWPQECRACYARRTDTFSGSTGDVRGGHAWLQSPCAAYAQHHRCSRRHPLRWNRGCPSAAERTDGSQGSRRDDDGIGPSAGGTFKSWLT